MKGDMRRQGEGGSSRKFLIKEEGRLLFTWLEEVGGGGFQKFVSPTYVSLLLQQK